MKSLYLLASALCMLTLAGCQPENREVAAPEAEKVTVSATPVDSMVLLHVAHQGFDYGQPWNKKKPSYSSGFAIYLGDGNFLTNAGIVLDASFLELLSPDGSKTAMGRIKAADYEANLALVHVEGDAAEEFLKGLRPVELAEAPSLGDEVGIWQFNDDGLSLIALGSLESTTLDVPMTPGVSFVLYQVRSSVNAVTGGASMPVMVGDKLAGLSISYEASEQNMLAVTTPMIKSFLDRALSDKPYEGIPVFGLQPSDLRDPVFREYLKMPEGTSGLYALKISPKSSAEQAGLKEGDVIESINGISVDNRGIVQDEKLGAVSCSLYLHDLTKVGDVLKIGIRRDGEQKEIDVTMNRDALVKSIIPRNYEPGQPKYLVYGGLVFQPMTGTYLNEVFENNPNKMSLAYLEALDDPEALEKEGRDEIIMLAGVLPTPATHGYNNYGGAVVTKINGVVPKDMKHLEKLLDDESGGDIIKIEINKSPRVIYFSRKDAKASDDYIKRVAFQKLRNL